MRISLGGFGQAIAQPANLQVAPSQTGQAVAALSSIVEQQQAQQQQMDRAENAKFLAEYGNAMQEISGQLAMDVNSGAIRADQYSEEFRNRTKAWRDERLVDLPTRRQQLLQPTLDLYETESLGRASAAQSAFVQGARQATDQSTLGELLKQSQMDPDGAIQQGQMVIEANPYWGAEQKSAMASEFADRARFSNRDLWIENQTNIGVLRKERQALADGAYSELMPNTRRTLIERAEQRIAELDAKIRTEQNAAEIAAQKTAKDVTDAKLRGFKVSPQADMEAAAIISQYGEKPWAKDLASANQDAAAMRNMALRPVTTQGIMVADARRKLAEVPADQVGAATDRVLRLEQAYRQNVEMARKDPWGYFAATRGEDELPPPLVFDETLPSQFAIRNERAQLVQAGVGVNPGIFLPSEIPTAVRFLDALPAEQKLNMLAELSNLDRTTANATFDSIGKQKPVYGMAGKLHSYGGVINNRPAADLMLKGHAALESKAFQIADKSNLNAELADQIGQIFSDSPEDYAAAKEAITWTLAGIYQSRGEFKVDVVDSGDLGDAVKAIVNPAEVKGRKVSAPIGIDPDDFHEQIMPKLEQAIQKANVSEDNRAYLLDDATLRDAPGDGRYYVAWDDGRLVYDLNNNPIVVSLQ